MNIPFVFPCQNSKCAPNYKQLKTSYNNTYISCKQHYSLLARYNGNGIGSKMCSLNNYKNRITGVPKPIVIKSNTRLIKKQFPMKIFCTYSI